MGVAISQFALLYYHYSPAFQIHQRYHLIGGGTHWIESSQPILPLTTSLVALHVFAGLFIPMAGLHPFHWNTAFLVNLLIIVVVFATNL